MVRADQRKTPEFRLVCLALRRAPTEADGAALRAAVAARPDWNAVVKGAQRHTLAGPLRAALSAAGAPPPDWAAAALRTQALAAAAACLSQIAELARLTPRFEAAGVRRLVLKGVALAAQLYGDPCARSPRDIDLLVDPTRFADAEAVLAGAGYRPLAGPMTPQQGAAYHRWIRDSAWVNPSVGVMVELHTRLTDDAALIAQDFETLWAERETVRLGAAPVDTLPRHRLALYLTAHAAGHAWERLCWLVDLAALLDSEAAADAAQADADAAGLGAPMGHALLMAHDWLGAPVSAALLARLRADRRVARLARLAARAYDGQHWRQSPARASWAGFMRHSVWQRLYRLGLKPGWRYQARQLTRELVSPADWATVRLPDRLFWLYPAVRPFGWLARRLRISRETFNG